MEDIKGYPPQQFIYELEKEETTTLKSIKKSGATSNDNLHSEELLFTVEDTPPWYLCLFLAFQHYLTFLGSVISLPFLLAPALCLSTNDPARVYLTSTMLFIFGIVTLAQTILGIRLPIVQGGSFAYLVPAFVILNLPEWRCPNTNETLIITSENNFTKDAIWMSRIRELQGDVALASIFQIFIGVSGLSGFILRWITPLVITPTITLIGLSLFQQSTKLAGKNWPVSIGSIVLMILFSQYLRNTKIPVPIYTRQKGLKTLKYPIFGLLPVLLSTAIMWGLCAILTSSNVFSDNDPARTDMRGEILNSSPWIRVSYPLQWGIPSASVAGVVGMMSAVIASVIESIGDYYACARLCGAPPPPVSAINRGIAIEGFGGVLAGLWGVGVGATSFSQNIGAIGITKVGSRRVIQYAAVIMILFGTFTKFGAAFAIIPEPIIGGIYCVMFGIITGVGISSAQFVDLNSPRNLFILGFTIFFGLAFPTWISNHNELIKTGIVALDQAITVLLSTNMLLGGVLGFILDNTIPGSDEERGLTKWRAMKSMCENDDHQSTYRVPFNLTTVVADKENKTIENLLQKNNYAKIEIVRCRQDSPAPDSVSNNDVNQAGSSRNKRRFGNTRDDYNRMPIINEDLSSQPFCYVKSEGFLSSTPKEDGDGPAAFIPDDVSRIYLSKQHEIPKLDSVHEHEEIINFEPVSPNMNVLFKFESPNQNNREEQNIQQSIKKSPHSKKENIDVHNIKSVKPKKKPPHEYPICPIILLNESKFRPAPILVKVKSPHCI